MDFLNENEINYTAAAVVESFIIIIKLLFQRSLKTIIFSVLL